MRVAYIPPSLCDRLGHAWRDVRLVDDCWTATCIWCSTDRATPMWTGRSEG